MIFFNPIVLMVMIKKIHERTSATSGRMGS